MPQGTHEFAFVLTRHLSPPWLISTTHFARFRLTANIARWYWLMTGSCPNAWSAWLPRWKNTPRQELPAHMVWRSDGLSGWDCRIPVPWFRVARFADGDCWARPT